MGHSQDNAVPAWCIIVNHIDFILDHFYDGKGSFQKKKKRRNIWKIPYLRGRGGSAGGHFPYVITEDLKCIKSHFEHF